MQGIKILLVDSHQLSREGLRRLLGSETHDVVGVARSLDDAAEQMAAGLAPEMLVYAFEESTSANQSAIVDQLRAQFSGLKVVILANNVSSSLLSQAINAGVSACLLRDMSIEALSRSLELVMLGQQVFPTQAALMLIGNRGLGPHHAGDGSSSAQSARTRGVSGREGEILRSLLSGHSNKQIARQLGISEATVKVHLKAVMRKTNAQNRTQAAVWGLASGFGEKPGIAKVLFYRAAGDLRGASALRLVQPLGFATPASFFGVAPRILLRGKRILLRRKIVAHGENRRLGAVHQVQFRQHDANHRLDDTLRNIHQRRDGLIGLSVGEMVENGPFVLGERFQRGDPCGFARQRHQDADRQQGMSVPRQQERLVDMAQQMIDDRQAVDALRVRPRLREMLAVNEQDHDARLLNAGDLVRVLAMDAPQRAKVDEADIEPDIAVVMPYERGRVAIRDDLDGLRIELLHDRG